jgi:hypothetical protein
MGLALSALAMIIVGVVRVHPVRGALPPVGPHAACAVNTGRLPNLSAHGSLYSCQLHFGLVLGRGDMVAWGASGIF